LGFVRMCTHTTAASPCAVSGAKNCSRRRVQKSPFLNGTLTSIHGHDFLPPARTGSGPDLESRSNSQRLDICRNWQPCRCYRAVTPLDLESWNNVVHIILDFQSARGIKIPAHICMGRPLLWGLGPSSLIPLTVKVKCGACDVLLLP